MYYRLSQSKKEGKDQECLLNRTREKNLLVNKGLIVNFIPKEPLIAYRRLVKEGSLHICV